MPKLLKMKPGSRVVTHDFDMGPWHADETIELAVAEKLIGPIGKSKVFLFVVPADVRGTWRSDVRTHGGHWEFEIEQTYRRSRSTARAGDVADRSCAAAGCAAQSCAMKTMSGWSAASRRRRHITSAGP